MTRVLLILIAALSIGAKGCDIDTGDLVISDFVRTYDVTVTNAGPKPVLATINIKDVGRAMLIDPGGSESVTSFSGGQYLVTADTAGDLLTTLRQKRDQVDAKLRDPKLDPREIPNVLSDIRYLNLRISSPIAERESGGCVGNVNVTAAGKGGSAVVSLAYDEGLRQWAPSCP